MKPGRRGTSNRRECYFFSGGRYIRVTRGDTGPGTVDAGYPADISGWRWPDGFGRDGIDAALYSGSKCYFFSGGRYIRVTRGAGIQLVGVLGDKSRQLLHQL